MLKSNRRNQAKYTIDMIKSNTLRRIALVAFDALVLIPAMVVIIPTTFVIELFTKVFTGPYTIVDLLHMHKDIVRSAVDSTVDVWRYNRMQKQSKIKADQVRSQARRHNNYTDPRLSQVQQRK